VADNLRVGGSGLDIERALLASGALDFVKALPKGLDTRLGERGLRLSGGQRQRLSLARALMKQAPLLLLDEALSALEPQLEEQILDRLTALGSSTLVLVTHRLRTAERFDRVLVFQAGRLIEAGPPAQLLRSGGWFARAHATSEQGGEHPSVAPASPSVAPASGSHEA
jgi:ABC-type multidrug transport system fused ATPase/permease subunit